MESRANSMEKRIDGIEAAGKWAVGIVIGVVIVAALSYVVIPRETAHHVPSAEHKATP